MEATGRVRVAPNGHRRVGLVGEGRRGCGHGCKVGREKGLKGCLGEGHKLVSLFFFILGFVFLFSLDSNSKVWHDFKGNAHQAYASNKVKYEGQHDATFDNPLGVLLTRM